MHCASAGGAVRPCVTISVECCCSFSSLDVLNFMIFQFGSSAGPVFFWTNWSLLSFYDCNHVQFRAGDKFRLKITRTHLCALPIAMGKLRHSEYVIKRCGKLRTCSNTCERGHDSIWRSVPLAQIDYRPAKKIVLVRTGVAPTEN